jgi:hypothetical protein
VAFDNPSHGTIELYEVVRPPSQLKDASGFLRHTNSSALQSDTQKTEDPHIVDHFWFDQGDPLGKHSFEVYVNGIRKFKVDFEVVEPRCAAWIAHWSVSRWTQMPPSIRLSNHANMGRCQAHATILSSGWLTFRKKHKLLRSWFPFTAFLTAGVCWPCPVFSPWRVFFASALGRYLFSRNVIRQAIIGQVLPLA